jgi:hypothetical protein
MKQNILPIQQSFAGGEVSPRVSLRSDTDNYHVSVETAENFISWLQGPASRRSGFKHLASIEAVGGRLIPFQASTFISFMMLITPTLVHILDPSGVFYTTWMVDNPDFIDEGTSWDEATGVQSYIAYDRGQVHMFPGENANGYCRMWQESDTLSAGDTYAVVLDPIAGDAEITVRVGTTEHGTDVYTGTFPKNQVALINLGTGFTGTLWVEMECSDSAFPKEVEFFGLVQLDDGGVQFTSPWTTLDQIREIQWDMPPGEDFMVLCQNSVAQQKIEYDVSTRLWTLGAVTYSNAPAAWTTDNYPGCITFHEGRLWHGRIPSSEESFWASKSGDYFDFDLGSSLDADGISFSIDRRGAICWMAGLKDLIIGTERSEYIVKSSAGVITASDISVEAQTHNGSAFIQPALVNNTIVFVNKDSRKIREMHYSWTEGGWISQDISFWAEHIPREDPIIELSFALNPESILWLRTTSGKLVACTFDPEKKSIGWHRHPTDGYVHSAAVLEVAGKGVLYLFVKRCPDTNFITYEKMDEEAYMDSFVFLENQTASNVIPATPHLEDREVYAVVDGNVHPKITLDEDGAGTLQWAGNEVYYGLAYTSTLKTLAIDKGAQAGSSQGLTKRWTKIFVALLESHRPTINGTQPPTRLYSTPMGSAEELRTEDVKVTNLGYNREAAITIETELPLPCNVLALYGKLSQAYV